MTSIIIKGSIVHIQHDSCRDRIAYLVSDSDFPLLRSIRLQKIPKRDQLHVKLFLTVLHFIGDNPVTAESPIDHTQFNKKSTGHIVRDRNGQDLLFSVGLYRAVTADSKPVFNIIVNHRIRQTTRKPY